MSRLVKKRYAYDIDNSTTSLLTTPEISSTDNTSSDTDQPISK